MWFPSASVVLIILGIWGTANTIKFKRNRSKQSHVMATPVRDNTKIWLVTYSVPLTILPLLIPPPVHLQPQEFHKMEVLEISPVNQPTGQLVSLVAQSAVPGPAASAMPGDLLEKENLQAPPGLTELMSEVCQDLQVICIYIEFQILHVPGKLHQMAWGNPRT